MWLSGEVEMIAGFIPSSTAFQSCPSAPYKGVSIEKEKTTTTHVQTSETQETLDVCCTKRKLYRIWQGICKRVGKVPR